MKKMKKILAMLLALTMVLGMSLSSMAATKPVESDHAEVAVQNVEEDSTLTAYQIIDATYDEKGFTGYVWANGMTNEGDAVTFTIGSDDKAYVNGLTSTMITELAKNPTGLATVTSTDSTKIDLTVGTWMILVTPKTNAAKIYNPMIVSVYYDTEDSGDSSDVLAGTVDANTNWILETTDAFAKSSDVDAKKTVTDAKAEVDGTVEFKIETTIPSYSAEYTSATFKIIDTIVNGLEYSTTEPVVKVNNTAVTKETEYTYTLAADGKSFTIEFKSDYILGLADKTKEERAVVVTYSAVVTEDAVEKVGENKVSLNYTRKPGEETTADKDTELVFTVTVDGVFEKVDENNDELSGATFTLYKKVTEAEAVNADSEELNSGYEKLKINSTTEEYVKVIGTDVTETEGKIEFDGLDADETYYLKETAAPDGYSLNDTVYEITFGDFVYDTDGKMTSYAVYVDGTKVGTIVYGKTLSGTVTQITNTKLNALPSTGGIGTTIFTVAGCGIMIAAAYFFFASRKKEN